MSDATVNLELPRKIFDGLVTLANESNVAPADLIAQWLDREREHRAWLQDWHELRTQIEADGGLNIGKTKEEIVEHMKQARREIFEAEYAHLYR